MYKVFVENRAIILCQKNNYAFDSRLFFDSQVKSLEKDIYPFFSLDKEKLPYVIVCDDAQATFNRLFEHHDWIEAAGGIVQKDGRYLFIKRNGKWDIPKGKLEKGEDPALGAIREIEEECGIVGPTIDSLIIETFHTYRYKDTPTIKRTFWYALDYEGDDELIPQKEEGITKAKFVKPEKLDKIRSNTFASILEVMDTYFNKKGSI